MFQIDNGSFCICDECDLFYYGHRDLNDDHCMCDKTGYEIYVFGRCCDAYVHSDNIKRYHRKYYGRLYRRYLTKKVEGKKIKRSYSAHTGKSYLPFVPFYDECKKHLTYNRNSNRQRILKRLSNKKIRSNKIYLDSNPSGKRAFHKLYNYWWELY